MKKALSIIIYVIELIITFLIIYIGITVMTIHLVNQGSWNYNVYESLIVSQIVIVFLVIIVRFTFIPIKILTRSIELIKFYKIMSWILFIINVVFLITLCILTLTIQEGDSQVYEIKNLIFQFIGIYALLYFVSGLILYIKAPSSENQRRLK